MFSYTDGYLFYGWREDRPTFKLNSRQMILILHKYIRIKTIARDHYIKA